MPRQQKKYLFLEIIIFQKKFGSTWRGKNKNCGELPNKLYHVFKIPGDVKVTDIDVAFLKQLEAWMIVLEYSITTVGIYTRCMRAIFNEVIFQGLIKREKCYPFGRRKYQYPMSHNVKKALSLEEVRKIYYYEPMCEFERKAKNFWLFSYLANGINLTDIAYLKYKNIEEDYITFNRSKTENATRSSPRRSLFILLKTSGQS